ncbi:MAG: damage-inducible protein DinB [Acidobacteria bacterium]|nr:damage-inducible protein DinB [Acidobacteriota bacterium]
MNTTGLLQDLFLHMAWADALVWASVLKHPALVNDTLLRERLYHTHLVQRAFLHIWRGEEMHFDGTNTLRGEELAGWGRDYHSDVSRFLGTIKESRLDSPVHLPWASRIMQSLGTELTDPKLGETLMQVSAHSRYHRGQVNTRIRELGVKPPLTDFIAWVWSGKPKPSWPSETESQTPEVRGLPNERVAGAGSSPKPRRPSRRVSAEASRKRRSSPRRRPDPSRAVRSWSRSRARAT